MIEISKNCVFFIEFRAPRGLNLTEKSSIAALRNKLF